MNIKTHPLGHLGDGESGTGFCLVFQKTQQPDSDVVFDIMEAWKERRVTLSYPHDLLDDEVFEEFLHENVEGLASYRCGHEHDCCGCVSYGSAKVIGFDPINEAWVVSQSYRRNV